ncbi:MAG: hypothetical protein IPO09_02240 [Anaeromyxobacter sp.]|nr:hypothetical protein [Anaeromyxobacter sp.]MBL0277541.1 hypothetical protein [Anaeromyxobacter sp.]
MKALTRDEAVAWCAKHDVLVDERHRPVMTASAIDEKIENDAGRRVAMVRQHFRDFGAPGELLVWFTDWSVWPSGELPHLFQRLRLSYGEHRPLIETPAQVFAADEVEDALSFVALGVLFLWDCFVLSASQGPLAFYSHDEVATVVRSAVDRDAGPRP